LKTATRGRGGFEISLTYTHQKDFIASFFR